MFLETYSHLRKTKQILSAHEPATKKVKLKMFLVVLDKIYAG